MIEDIRKIKIVIWFIIALFFWFNGMFLIETFGLILIFIAMVMLFVMFIEETKEGGSLYVR